MNGKQSLSPDVRKSVSATKAFAALWLAVVLMAHSPLLSMSQAGENVPQSPVQNDEITAAILNPFDATCYDWRGEIIPCGFRNAYGELLTRGPIPDHRFVDNRNGTVTDLLTGLVWLKNANCFKMMDWKSAEQAAEGLKDGDCGPDPDLVLSDGSSAGDWRLPTMKELCTLIDYRKRNPALPNSHKFRLISGGYHWSATRLEYDSEMAWIVYFESGTTCYEDINNHAGYVWPVRKKE